MYEQFEHLLQGLVSPLDHLKNAYSELADDLFRKLRQQIEVTQNELREGEQLEVYYTAQGHEPILVSRMGYLEPHLLVLYGQDDHNNDCKVLAHLLTAHLTLKLVRHGDPAKRRTISFVEPTKGTWAGGSNTAPEECVISALLRGYLGDCSSSSSLFLAHVSVGLCLFCLGAF